MITYPLNNIDYAAEDAELFHCTRTSGIWAENSFPISVTGADNNVTIGTGIAWINNEEFSGKVSALKSAKTIDLGIADGVYPRIDVIAIQFNANNNATDVVLKKGTPASNPVRPVIVRSGAVYELYLASVYRPAGTTTITASNITDLRMDTTVCGLMADSVTKVDMEAIRAQLIGLVEELEDAIQNIEVGEIVPIEKGGTNAQTSAEARQNINFIGDIPITTAEDDTISNWIALGTGVARGGGHGLFPTDHGFLINYVDDKGEYISQVWTDITGNEGVWRRIGYVRDGSFVTGDYITPWRKDTELKLLWENPDCTQDFEGQSVSLYDPYENAFPTIVVALFNVSKSNVRKVSSIGIVGTYGEVQWTGNIDSASETYFASRRWLMGTGGNITFSNATRKQGDTSITKNDILIPHSVYSIGAYHRNWS